MNRTFHPLLKDAYDFHVHSAPSIFERKQNDWEVVQDAIEAQMGGVVLKSHESSTAERAFLLREKEPSLHVFGGVVLNSHVGGLNPDAVEAALKMGGKVVWFPTLSTAQHQHYFSSKNTKLYSGSGQMNKTIDIEENGTLKNEVYEIFSLIKQYNVVLATGHLSLEQTHKIVKQAQENGVEKIIIQHADMGIAKIPIKDQKYFASKGCIIEKCFLAISSDFMDLTIEEMARSIEEIGHQSCILVTDYGQPHNEPSILAFNRFVEELLHSGMSEEKIAYMVRRNPESLLNI